MDKQTPTENNTPLNVEDNPRAREVAALHTGHAIFFTGNKILSDALKAQMAQHNIDNIQFESGIYRLLDSIEKSFTNGTPIHYIFFHLGQRPQEINEWKLFYPQLRNHLNLSQTPMIAIIEKTSATPDGESNSSTDYYPPASDSYTQQIFIDPAHLNGHYLLTQLSELILKIFPEGQHYFNIEKKVGHLIVNVPILFDKNSLIALKKLEFIFINCMDVIIFNFKNFDDTSNTTLRECFQLFTTLQKGKQKYYSVFIPQHILDLVHKLGMYNTFKVKNGIREILTEHNLSTASSKAPGKFLNIDVRIINPFITSTIETYQKFLNIVLEPKPPKISNNYDCSSAAFAIVISIESDKFTGLILQIFKVDVFKKYLMTVKEARQIQEMQAMINFTNQMLMEIFASAKAELVRQFNYELDRASPQIVQKPENIQKLLKNPISIHVSLDSSIGPLDLLINPLST